MGDFVDVKQLSQQPQSLASGLVYLASPYSDEDWTVREARFVQACEATGWLMRHGVSVFSPVVYTQQISLCCNLPYLWKHWEQFDRHFLGVCDRMIVLTIHGWETSVGVREEMALCRAMGKGITYMYQCDGITTISVDPEIL